MDRRLIATVAFIAHLIGGGMFAIAVTTTDVVFGESQLQFVVLVGYLGPAVAMALLWARNYGYGAPLLVSTAGLNAWFALYFFVIHQGPSNVDQVTDGAYTSAVAAVVFTSVVFAGVGTWLWYAESPGFRSTVDRYLYPPESRD